MAKHTPGPWDYDMGDFSIYQVETSDVVAELFSDHSRAEQEANARLVAAAPELLEALKMAVHVLAELSDATSPHVLPVRRVAVDAIKKAAPEYYGLNSEAR